MTVLCCTVLYWLYCTVLLIDIDWWPGYSGRSTGDPGCPDSRGWEMLRRLCLVLKTLVTAAIMLMLILITSDCLVQGSGSLSEMKMIAEWWLEDLQPQPSLYPPNKQTVDTVLRRDLRLLFWIVDWNFRLLIAAGGGGGRRVCVEMWWRCWSLYWALMEETHRGFAELQPGPQRWRHSDGLSVQLPV